jgi:hypothetical protein
MLRIHALKKSEQGVSMTDLKAAVFTVLEGWALPLDARKILETAYYAQPEREWVGLTDEERDELLNGSTRVPSRLIDWVEQKLKEKNGG